jgi:hypothetical protein
MNSTPSVDEPDAERNRAAAANGHSLLPAEPSGLGPLAGPPPLAAELDAFEQSALDSPGRLRGWRFDREEANCREQPVDR